MTIGKPSDLDKGIPVSGSAVPDLLSGVGGVAIVGVGSWAGGSFQANILLGQQGRFDL
jgi:hypothetical protein